MHRSQAIIFDLGGTLLYPDFPFLQTILKGGGQAITQNQFLLALSKASNRIDTYRQATTDASRVPVYLKYLLEELQVEEFQVSEKIEELVQQVILPRHQTVNFWNYLLEGTLALLATLQQTYKLAIISNSDGRAAAKAAQYGIAPYLDFIIDSHVVGVEKPDPQIFMLACQRLGLPARNCYYVVDIYSIDVVGAHKAGLHPILIDMTQTPREDCRVISSIFDLQHLFLP
jgi:HAD superfamily hydrolase (TIGR01549 family)